MSECGPEFDVENACTVRHCEFKGESDGVITVRLGRPNLMQPDDESSLTALLQQYGYAVTIEQYTSSVSAPESG